MEMKKVKTVFIDAPTQGSTLFSGNLFKINGDELARLTQAVIDEMEIDGYEFMQAQTIISNATGPAATYTEGTLLYFKLSETKLS